MNKTFKCGFCGQTVHTKGLIGTHHRNHCPNCLWSKHLGQSTEKKKLKCGGIMEPIGLTFKQEGVDKYGQTRQGELMVIHRCTKDQETTINRLAADDNPKIIMDIFEKSQGLDLDTKQKLTQQGIELLGKSAIQQIKTQLFRKHPV